MDGGTDSASKPWYVHSQRLAGRGDGGLVVFPQEMTHLDIRQCHNHTRREARCSRTCEHPHSLRPTHHDGFGLHRNLRFPSPVIQQLNLPSPQSYKHPHPHAFSNHTTTLTLNIVVVCSPHPQPFFEPLSSSRNPREDAGRRRSEARRLSTPTGDDSPTDS
jgi:hypothetical protein